MEIESKLKGSVKFGNETTVVFDNLGISEVEDKIAKQLILNYPNTVWQKGKKKTEASKAEDKKPENGVELQIQSLENKVEYLNGIIEEKNKEIKKAKGCEQVWREQYEQLAKQVEIAKKPVVVVEEAPEVKQETPYSEDLMPFFDEMKSKNAKVLRKWLLENEVVLEDEIKDITERDDLIKFALVDKKDKFLE